MNVTPLLRIFSPSQDLKFIAELNELERAELNQLMPHPELWKFLQGDTEATLKQREQVAVEMHMSNGSNPPWFQVGRVVNLDDYDWQHRVRTMADQLHEKNRVHISEAQHYEREMSAQASRALYKERVDTNDVTHIPKEADTTKRNSILEVKQSNLWKACYNHQSRKTASRYESTMHDES